jgi:hypothetical protein
MLKSTSTEPHWRPLFTLVHPASFILVTAAAVSAWIPRSFSARFNWHLPLPSLPLRQVLLLRLFTEVGDMILDGDCLGGARGC